MENLQNLSLTTEEIPISLDTWVEVFPVAYAVVYGIKAFSATLSMFGVLGNLLTMLVIAQWQNLTSGAAFMFSLALTDFMTVLYDGVIELLLPLFDIHLIAINDVTCAVGSHFTFGSTLSSYYVTALFSLDKCLAVLLPFKYREYGKPKVCVISTIIAYVLMAIWTGIALFVFRVEPGAKICRAREFGIVSRHFYLEVRPKYSTIVHGVIPISSVFLFTTLTILKLRLTRNRKNQNQSAESAGRQSRRDLEITRQMIVVCSIFVTFSLIFSICANIMLGMDRNTVEKEKSYNLYRAIMYLCQAVINSANFYMYVLFGQKFRASVMNLLRRKRANASRKQTISKPTTDSNAPAK